MGMVKICPNCGHRNTVNEVMCTLCMADLTMVQPVEDISEEDCKTVVFSQSTLILRNEDYNLELPPNKEYIIGRHGEGKEYFSKFPYVSRKHARILYENGSWYVEDLKSTNHTYLNGKKLEEITKLNNGDEIKFSSKVKFRVIIRLED